MRRRKPGEDLQHLYQDIARLILLAYPDRSDDVTDLVGRDAFLDALEDEDLPVRILDREPPDLDAALKHAVKLESYTGGRKTAEPNRYSADRPPRQKEHFSRVVTEEEHHLSSPGSQPVEMSEDRLIKCFKESMKSFLNENSTQLNQPTGGQRKKSDDGDSNRQRGGGRKNSNTSFTPSYGD